MCKRHSIRFACGHRLTSTYSICRGTYTWPSREFDGERNLRIVACLGNPALKLRATFGCPCIEDRPIVQKKREPRKPQLRASQLGGSPLRFEVKPWNIVELTEDFEELPGWLFES